MATTTYFKVNIWGYLSRVGITGVVALIIISLFVGQAISSSFIGQWLGWTDFTAGPGMVLILYLMGSLAGIYAIGWYNPALNAPEGLVKRILIGVVIAVACFGIGMFIKTWVPGLFAIMPMKLDMTLQPFSVVGFP